MWHAIVAPSLIPPTISPLDATEPVRAVALGTAAAAIAVLAWLAGMARPRPVVARHTFASVERDHRPGHASPFAA